MNQRQKRIAGGFKITVILLLVILIASFVLFQHIINAASIMMHGVYVKLCDDTDLGKRTSSFHDAYLDGDYVYYRCTVTVVNCTSDRKRVKICGISFKDYISGHIDSPFMECVDSNHCEYILDIGPYQTQTLEPVYLRGKHNPTSDTLKYDRSLPLIYFTPS